MAKRSLSEGTVQLEECIWDNGSVTYDVCLIYTSSQATSKNFHSIETIEEACRIYNEYSEELCEVYKSKFRKTQRKEGKLIIQVQWLNVYALYYKGRKRKNERLKHNHSVRNCKS